jgi:mono/diheme cytochrome c family protein
MSEETRRADGKNRSSALLARALAIVWCAAAYAADPSPEFASLRAVLVEHCGACHNAGRARGPANFLRAQNAADIESDRGLWRNVAAQLRNRTMPPVASKLTEEDRLRAASWIDNRLRTTACSAGPFAGAPAIRRLNRREYHNTIRDLLGVDFDAVQVFPADGTGGAGFDTNGETLYTPPMMMERYLQAAQEILDRAIVTAPLSRAIAPESHQIPTGDGFTFPLAAYSDADYIVVVNLIPLDPTLKISLKVDGSAVGSFNIRQPSRSNNAGLPLPGRLQVHLARGEHALTIAASESEPIPIATIDISQRPVPIAAEKRSLHYRLLGVEPGQTPLDGRRAAREVLTAFLARAFRRPVEPAEIDRFLTLYDRAAQRGDPWTERMKLALSAVLVHPDFLFRVEHRGDAPGIRPMGQYELASRLSYFLWSAPPDETLLRLAEQSRLQDPAVLAAQVERMLDGPRSRAFSESFVGQWLGTQDLGGRAAPLLTELQSYYTPEVAADLRAEPVLLFDHILGENRSLLELIGADYTFLTERLVRFYQLEGKVAIQGNDFQRVAWPDNRRGGVTGMGAVLALNSHYAQTSPVLRGAWVLETLLGTPVPPPPPNTPPLDPDRRLKQLSTREKLEQHRADPACAACHRLMDPIGFALENFDWMGRWRETESNGKPLDTAGSLPSGDAFHGPVELRQTLLRHTDEFLRNLAGKVMGYALGRGLQDGDSCTVQRLVDTVGKDGYRARTLVREVVLSVPFRNVQAGAPAAAAVPAAAKPSRPKVVK